MNDAMIDIQSPVEIPVGWQTCVITGITQRNPHLVANFFRLHGLNVEPDPSDNTKLALSPSRWFKSNQYQELTAFLRDLAEEGAQISFS